MKALIAIIIFCSVGENAFPQQSYGNNKTAGNYLLSGDAHIYYEIYGTGKPLVLLHGGIYGYIDEFEKLIPVLSRDHQVIAIATRGHGKSELGAQPFSFPLFASDAYQVIKHITSDSVTIIGFSDGADIGYFLAALHPETVKKLIAIGGNFGYSDFTAGDKAFIDGLSGKNMDRNEKGFVDSRRELMPEPERFDEFIDKMAILWRKEIYVEKQTLSAIRCPVLVSAGQDDGCPIEHYVTLYRLLKKGSLAIIPGSDHLVLIRKPLLMQEIIKDYLNQD